MAGIYIHIPFCRKACTYCNFHFSTSLSQKEDMLAAIAWELENQKEYLQGARIETVYLGGGTPSLLSVEELQRIFEVIGKHYDTGSLKECTLETNPDDLNAAYIKALKQTPVNRFSIGVQSFFDSDLRYMNRAHNAQQADYAIKAAQDAGFENLTIDLIYGTPGLSNRAWLENLARTEALQIPHFSAYALTVEEGTALHHAIQHKKQTPVDQEQSAAQLELLMDYAPKMGFEQYEISNFAARQQYALHNTNYWKGIPYLGAGPSAHSFDGQHRRSNVANNSRYIRSILQEKKLDFEEEQLTEQQRLNEYIMTSLRTKWGCDLQWAEQKWGASAALKKASQPFLEQNWLSLENNVLLLTNAGKLFADHIAAELFAV
ncbi:MAG: radical SAM family heme chaperone HemW [Chitinophagaceae bacterium]|nr:radical SAM family heme chaperone HemW [Chitinophagaceae bacterium]